MKKRLTTSVLFLKTFTLYTNFLSSRRCKGTMFFEMLYQKAPSLMKKGAYS